MGVQGGNHGAQPDGARQTRRRGDAPTHAGARRREAADQDALRRPSWRRGLRENAMKATDLRPKTNDQLKEELGNLRKEAFNLRFQKAGGQLGKTGRVRQVRRDIARIKTVLGEKAAG